MSVLSPPSHESVNRALSFTREVCRDEKVDGSTALRHAVGVVITLEEFVPTVEPRLAAGIIMHDTPYAVSDQGQLDEVLRTQFDPETHRIVRTIEREHAYMGTDNGSGYNEGLRSHVAALLQDEPVLLATAADKITSFRNILGRANRSDDPYTFFDPRPAFKNRMPYFVGFHAETAPHIPPRMADELGTLVSRAYDLTGLANN